MSELQQYNETHKFDAEFTDSRDITIAIDCEVQLPNIWGEVAIIKLAIPHSVMPVKSSLNPCQLKTKLSNDSFRLEMNDIWFRKLTTSVYPKREFGASLISVTHVSCMKITEKSHAPNSKFLVYISSPDFLAEANFSEDRGKMIEDLASFTCPKLGLVYIQRYWVSSLIESGDAFTLKAGYLLAIDMKKALAAFDDDLIFIKPILDLLSIFFRQRVLMLGWESVADGTRQRFWKYPLESSKTKFVNMKPQKYLVSFDNLSEKLKAALDAYYNFEKKNQESISKLSYSLSPAIKLSSSERFMSLFRDLESIATKSSSRKTLMDSEIEFVDSLREFAEPFRTSEPLMFERLIGFTNKLSSGNSPIIDNITTLLVSYKVSHSDLWKVSGNKGLLGIRNKLAHQGSHQIHHQGLAVATFHLSLLMERLLHCLLGINWTDEIHQIGIDEWQRSDYFHKLENRIFDVD